MKGYDGCHMLSLLVVDDQEIFRTPLAESLREEGYDVREAGTAPQALELAMRRRPDLMIIDISMPNIDGFELLRYFRGRAVFRSVPVIFLTAYARRDYLTTAASLGVKDFMLKSSFSLKDLQDRIASHVGHLFQRSAAASTAFPRSVPPPPEPPSTQPQHEVAAPKILDWHEFLENLKFRAFPGSIAEILAMAGDPNTSLSSFESVLRRDPGLAAQVVSTANTAPFRRAGQVKTIEEALTVLGMTQVVRIVTMGAVLRHEELSSDWGLDLRKMWSHCIAAGMVSQRLHEHAQEAYGFLLGLLHALPELMCLAHLKGDWAEWKKQGERHGWTTSATLGRAFGTDFVPLASDILASMHLPDSIVTPLRDHCAFFKAESPKEPCLEARVVEMAHQLAVVLGRSGGTLSPVGPLRADFMKRFRDAPSLALDLLPLEGQIQQWEMMSGMHDESVSLFPSDPVRILYWHSKVWFTPDPVESLLLKTGHAIHVDEFGDLEGDADLKIILAEPDSPEWNKASSLKGLILMLHQGHLANPSPKTVRTMRLPITEAMISNLLMDL